MTHGLHTKKDGWFHSLTRHGRWRQYFIRFSPHPVILATESSWRAHNVTNPFIHAVRYGLKGLLLFILPLPVLITAIGSLMRKGMLWIR